MSRPLIAIINASSILQDSEFPPVVAALNRQICGDLAPHWNLDAEFVFVPKGGKPPQGAWWQVLLDNSDTAGALGYHDFTSEGLPLGKSFAATAKAYGEDWRVTLSHECQEMVVDPDIVRCSFLQQAKGGIVFAYEISDPVQTKTYLIDGVPVSDAVTPAWFQPGARTGATYSIKKSIHAPFVLAPGGYVSLLKVKSGRWTQVNNRQEKDGHVELLQKVDQHWEMPKKPVLPGSRRDRRGRAREAWRISTAHVPGT